MYTNYYNLFLSSMIELKVHNNMGIFSLSLWTIHEWATFLKSVFQHSQFQKKVWLFQNLKNEV